MSSGSEFTDIREIQILCDQEATVPLGPFPDNLIGFSIDPLIFDRVGLVSKSRKDPHQRGWQVFVQLDFHAATGTAGSGRSSSAEEAA